MIGDSQTINAFTYNNNQHVDCMKRNRQRWTDKYAQKNCLIDNLVIRSDNKRQR